MKAFFKDLGRKIGDTAETVASKAGEVVEVQRLRNQMKSLEYSNEREYIELGKMVYGRFKEGEALSDKTSRICEEICSREKSMSKYEEQICHVKGHIKCCGCGKLMEKETCYCPHCGVKASEFQGSGVVEDEDCEDDVENVDCEVCKGDIKDTVVNMAEKIMGKADSATDALKHKSQDIADTIKEKTASTAEEVKGKAKEMEEKIRSMTEK